MPDAPDWITDVQVNVVVENVPIPPAAAKERAAGSAGNYSGSSLTYQEVASWTVAASKVGDLKEILILSDNYTKTEIRIRIGSITWCTDWNPAGSMPLIFEDLKLAAATEVKVEAQSTDGTAIDVDAIIVSKEIG